MKKPQYVGIVVGAGFGDEGKGLTTDYLLRNQGVGTKLVVRFNGGPQAGHTVTTNDGKRHVFSHFGSGTFAGANTYFSKFCCVNPFLFNKEWEALQQFKLSHFPVQIISGLCQITTPWDMIFNQNVERQLNHGSVGLGIGVTFDRSVKEFETPIGYFARISRAARRHEFGRLQDMLLDCSFRHSYDFMGKKIDRSLLTPEEVAWFNKKPLFEHFLDQLELMLSRVQIEYHGTHLFDYDHIVFEGAQGLLLDEKYGVRPHTTWSNTGCENALNLCNEMGITPDEVVYATRSYGTRHGSGPCYLDGTEPEPLGIEVEDKTNVPHPYQGMMRTFPLDVAAIHDVIYTDFTDGLDVLERGGGDCDKPKCNVMMTWAHLLSHENFKFRAGKPTTGENSLSEILRDFHVNYVAMGETADTVKSRLDGTLGLELDVDVRNIA